MSEYIPDSWRLIKITPKNGEVIYKVLASWYGGYLGSNHWKLSSGCKDFILKEGKYISTQYSGSVYILSKKTEHTSSLIAAQFVAFKRYAEENGASIDWAEIKEVEDFFN